MRDVGLVFAGGGAKGSYQIGVWKAIRELDIDVKTVVGTSIGSVNGALFAMGDYETAYRVWNSVTVGDIVNIETNKSNLFDISNIWAIIGEMYKNNGIDNSPLKKLLEQIIDEDRVRGSDIDYGLVTYSLTNFEERDMFISDIPKGELINYIMASACLPGFKSQEIGGEKFIDGAVNNNVPVNVLINRGVKNIIVVDVGGIGKVRGFDDMGVNVFTVKCGENILGTMEFNQESIEKNIKAGYLDCYKTFGRLMGNRYYFNISDYFRARINYSEDIMLGLECAAKAFRINNIAVYEIDKFIVGVVRGYRKAKHRYKELYIKFRKNSISEFAAELKKFDESVVIAWIVDRMINNDLEIIHNKIVAGTLDKGLLENSMKAASAVLYIIQNRRKRKTI